MPKQAPWTLALLAALALAVGTAGCGGSDDLDIPEGQSLKNPGGQVRTGPPAEIPKGQNQQQTR
ncbi:MAG: hypothetical protein N2109_02335 [Fimbriimonadales bacterium]|nr:hypothetical protein [Fimbriimonadales bacterium]